MTDALIDPDSERALLALPDVSRETLTSLSALAALLVKWNRSINLIARRDEAQLWSRHILDSAALWPVIRQAGSESSTVLDIGSGGGFPGLVLATLARHAAGDQTFDLVDSDQRKCAFLRESAARLNLPARVTCSRIEDLPVRRWDWVTARALASVDDLLGMTVALRKEGARLALLKGDRVKEELTAAQRRWHIEHQVLPNALTGRGYILIIERAQRI